MLSTAAKNYLAAVLIGKMWTNYRFILKNIIEKPKTKANIIF